MVGSRVLVADWEELNIFERDGDDVNSISSVPFEAAADVVADDRFAYVVDFYNGLKVVDISEPSSPSVVASEWSLGYADSIARVGSRLFIGTGSLGVQVIDISEPTSPTWVDTILMDDVVVDVSVAGGLLMVGTLVGGVELFSVRADDSVVHLGSYEAISWVEDSAYYGDKLYVKGAGNMAEVVDMKTPTDPVQVDTISGANREVSMRTGDDIFAIPTSGSGIWVHNVEAVD